VSQANGESAAEAAGMDYEEYEAHSENLAQPPEDPQTSLLRTATETELETGSKALRNLRAKDLPLANLKEADVSEGRWLIEIYLLRDAIDYPHAGSSAIGPMRVWASGGSELAEWPVDADERNENEQYGWGAYTRLTRGEGFKQQETVGKSIKESVLRRADEMASKTGFLGRKKR